MIESEKLHRANVDEKCMMCLDRMKMLSWSAATCTTQNDIQGETVPGQQVQQAPPTGAH